GAVVADAVAVLDGSGKHVGDGFDAAVRMPGKSGEIILRHVIAEIVEQKKGIELGRVAKAKCAPQVHACALRGGLAADQPLHRSYRHWSPPRFSSNLAVYAGARAVSSGSGRTRGSRNENTRDRQSIWRQNARRRGKTRRAVLCCSTWCLPLFL